MFTETKIQPRRRADAPTTNLVERLGTLSVTDDSRKLTTNQTVAILRDAKDRSYRVELLSGKRLAFDKIDTVYY